MEHREMAGLESGCVQLSVPEARLHHGSPQRWWQHGFVLRGGHSRSLGMAARQLPAGGRFKAGQREEHDQHNNCA